MGRFAYGKRAYKKRLIAKDPILSKGTDELVQTLGEKKGSKNRLSAARQLGIRGATEASAILIEKLEDKSYRVKEQACLALGKVNYHGLKPVASRV